MDKYYFDNILNFVENGPIFLDQNLYCPKMVGPIFFKILVQKLEYWLKYYVCNGGVVKIIFAVFYFLQATYNFRF